jgi:hypothetical protein
MDPRAAHADARHDDALIMRRGVRSRLFVALVSLAVLPAIAPEARGDGGVVRLSETVGELLVTVFTAPTPLRAGPVDVSVLVQQSDGKRPILDDAVSIALRPSAGGTVLHAAATHEQATNKLLYAAVVDLPTSGDWDLEVTVDHGGTNAKVTTIVSAGSPASPLLSFLWPYLLFPPISIVLFVLHEWLDSRQRPLDRPPDRARAA